MGFKCPGCNIKFVTKKELMAHLKSNRKCEIAAVMEIMRKTTAGMKMLEELFDIE